MRTFFVRALSVAALVALSFPPDVAAQGQSPAPLSEAQVQELISRGQPADHARLRAHFNELAEQSAAEAKRHASMQQSFAGNTKLAHMATSMAAHCKRLQDLNQTAAATLRELATEHGTLAAGAVYEPPQGGTRPQVDKGVPSDNELANLAANATSAADHRKLEQVLCGAREPLQPRRCQPRGVRQVVESHDQGAHRTDHRGALRSTRQPIPRGGKGSACGR